MQRFFTLFFVFVSNLIFSQEHLNRKENFDVATFRYLDSLTTVNNISIEEYLKFSKPFSKWDIRPIKEEKIWSLDSIRTSSEISNFFWGGFSQHYEISEKEAGSKPNEFLTTAQLQSSSNIKFLNENLNKFKALALVIQKNDNLIFLNQNSLQRVDDLYKENNKYWNYIIPENSPFPISTQTKIEDKIKFSKEQEKILKLMEEVAIYSIIKTNHGIFFLKDGFTYNSYGYYFSASKKMEHDNHLFEIMDFVNINDEF
ncbi:hypothetical protein LNP04_07030 [Chryseobacterium sp. C-71]|uniref:hypothetical protein n=1 Tax=Chryseobacterium sp. C-71 TaxID=2893882 RepID=UPI001E4B09EF|nr:hypothetical protein [Chryseobacterium sp. C-71]UFH33454.1 hypothetical protein LNP04_07030 [Chryseobacterium sp. C-71]